MMRAQYFFHQTWRRIISSVFNY